MPNLLSVLMAQINPTVGAIEANAELIIDIILQHQASHDIIVFPELSITGYPPEDLLLRPELFTRVERALEAILSATKQTHVIVGHPTLEQNLCFNSASIIHSGARVGLYHKQSLPNYGVFDEQRYFNPGTSTCFLFTVKGYKVGLCICEDIWQTQPIEQVIASHADLLLCINASPFDQHKPLIRENLLQSHAQRGLAIIYVNQIGGQDELVFDGQSVAFDAKGALCARLPAFVSQLQTVTLEGKKLRAKVTPRLDPEALIYQALVCGLRDYVNKNKFPGVLLGLSGGIDSALTLAIAVDALGAEKVQAFLLPSRYTATISNEDAQEQLRILQVNHVSLPIEPTFGALLSTLEPSVSKQLPNITQENLQARIRGILLMAISNTTGNMLLTTSNKSESAVGYSTLYGDMCGGFAVLKDVLKTMVCALARYRNQISPVIPTRVIERAPSAELAHNQTDQDSLPDYAVLDAIIEAYTIERLSGNDIIALGFAKYDVERTIELIKRNEYKRRQAAPGIKISACSFDRDWRYPITSGF